MLRSEYQTLDRGEPRRTFSNLHPIFVGSAVIFLLLLIALVGPFDQPTPQFSTVTPSTKRRGRATDFAQYVHPSLPLAAEVTSRRVNLSHHDEMMKSGIGRFIHISDTHYDPFFDPTETMGAAICHSCRFSTKVHGDKAYCPTHIPTEEALLEGTTYAFGRYGCNPPYRLIRSLYHAMQAIEEAPKFVVLTGDIAPHGYPGDNAKVTAHTKFEDMCPSKFLVMKHWVQLWRQQFPTTKLVFTLGNNDHYPKNTYWQPFIDALGDMFLQEGMFTKEEHKMFTQYGSLFYDVDGIRFLAVDFTLFTPGGEMSFVHKDDLKGLDAEEAEGKQFPVRHRTVEWIARVLEDAKAKGKPVYLIGHQPLTTKKGKDELDVEGVHYGRLQTLFAHYQDIIKIGMFGHRNLAALQPIVGPLGRPIIPSITAPGVSPRGKNLPSFNIMFYQKDGVVVDFEQWVFDLGLENAAAKREGAHYLGEWRMHHRDLYAWGAFSHGEPFTATALMHALKDIVDDERRFFAIELWKKAGYIGDETPENYHCKALYDTNAGMMRCLFPNQDERCWAAAWLK